MPLDRELLKQRLFQHVDRLAGLIGPRPFSNQRAFEAAATLVEREFASLGYPVQRQEYAIGERTAANLIAEIRGTRTPERIVVLGAHYDSVETTPGADDNGSAVAVLLETARLAKNWRPRRTIRFVAFACEELPHFETFSMGSQIHARACRKRGEQLVGMLCLEMVGYFSHAQGSQKVPPAIPRLLHGLFPRRGDFLAAVGNLRSWQLLWAFRRGYLRATRLPLFAIGLPEFIRDIRRSDNSSFWDQGYPALMLTDTSYLRNANYHESTDTPDTLDYGAMVDVTQGVLGGLAELAGAR